MKRKLPLLALLGFLSFPFFSLSDSVSQTNSTSVVTPKPAIKYPSIDSVIVYYSHIIDSNHTFTQSRIRSFINRVLAKVTDTDTSKSKVIIR